MAHVSTRRARFVSMGFLVLGCSSGGPDAAVAPVGAISQPAKKGSPTGKIGDADYCDDPANPCALGEGDCDLSSQCVSGLACTRGGVTRFHPGVPGDACEGPLCADKIQDGDETSIDCGGSCGSNCSVVCDTPNGAAGKCTTDCPCSVGEGDCNTDDECAPGLTCGQDIGALWGQGFPSGLDICWGGAHCKNHVEDADEIGVDCGGSCPPCAPPTVASVPLVPSGTPLNIVVDSAEASNSDVNDAATKLASTLQRITGATFSVTYSPTPSGISLGVNGDFAGAGWPYQGVFAPNDLYVNGVNQPQRIQPERLAKQDEYVVWSTGSRVILAGATQTALHHAVWDFLNHLGYRQYFPTPTWEVLPENAAPVASLGVHRTPAFQTRLEFQNGTKWTIDGFSTTLTQQMKDWQEKNRMTSDTVLNPGDTYDNVIEYWNAHHSQPIPPELVNDPSKDPTHQEFCLTGQATIEDGGVTGTVTAATVVQYYAKYSPAVLNSGSEFSLSPIQDIPWDSSLKADGTLNCNDINDPTYSSISNRAVALANAAADAQPQKVVGLLAYNFYSAPPTLALRQNVAVLADNLSSSKSLLPFSTQFADWSTAAAGAGVEDNYSATIDHERPGIEFGEIRGVPTTSRTIVENLTDYYQRGARFYQAGDESGWGILGLPKWTLSQMLWDAAAPNTLDAYRNDFLNNAFGQASTAMLGYFATLEDGRLWSEALIGSLYSALNDALAATSDSTVRKRIEDFVGYTRYLELYHHLESTCAPDQQTNFVELLKLLYTTRSTLMLDSLGTLNDLENSVATPNACITHYCKNNASCEHRAFVCDPTLGYLDPTTVPDGSAPDGGSGGPTGCPCTAAGWEWPCLNGSSTCSCGSNCDQTIKDAVAPTESQLLGYVNAGIANNATIPADIAVSYSNDLVAYTPPNANQTAYPESSPMQLTAGTVQSNLYTVGTAGTTIKVTEQKATAKDGSPLASAIYNSLYAEESSGEQLMSTFNFTQNVVHENVSLSTSFSGLHRLSVDTIGGGHWLLDYAPGTRMVMEATPDKGTTFDSRWSMYFFVPKTATSVSGWTSRDGHYYRSSQNASGQWTTDAPALLSSHAVIASDHTNWFCAVGLEQSEMYFEIPLTPGHGDEIWAFHDDADGSAGMRVLLSVPPQLARAPSEFLLPREVVPSP